MKYNVLIIEDDTKTANLFRAVLESEGYAVTVIADASALAGGLEEIAPAVIFLDALLTFIDSQVVAVQLRANPVTAATPLVVLAPRSHLATTIAANFEADAYLDRLCHRADLIATVAIYTRQRSRKPSGEAEAPSRRQRSEPSKSRKRLPSSLPDQHPVEPGK